MRNKFLLLFVVLAVNFTAHARTNKNLASQSQVFEGVVKVIIFEDGSGSRRYFLATGNRRLALSLTDDKFLNATVSVTGRLNAENTIIPENIKVLESSQKVLDIPVAGAQNVLVLLLNFQNDTSQPVPVEQIRHKIFADALSAKQYYQQVSGGRLRLTGRQHPEGDVFGYITLPFTNENCSTNGVVNEWAPAADNVALNNGINVNLYHSVIYLFTGDLPKCNDVFADLSAIGDRTTTNRVWFVNAFSEFNQSNFQYYMTHEIGHNLGLNHVSGWANCPTTVPFEACDNFQEYTDRADVMGYFGYHLLSNYNRLRLGWLSGKVTTFDSPGIYYVHLLPPSHPSKGTTAAQVRIKDSEGNFTGKSFYLEFRRNLPLFDIFREGEFPFPPIQSADKGVSIRYASENIYDSFNRPYLIDTTPETPDYGDAALLPGRTFTHSYYGIKITTISINPFFGARVKIEISACPIQSCRSGS